MYGQTYTLARERTNETTAEGNTRYRPMTVVALKAKLKADRAITRFLGTVERLSAEVRVWKR